ncbi:Fgenesh protein, partial [Trifolium medium]|nr:Fgenesh protein [Trifolium medium]
MLIALHYEVFMDFNGNMRIVVKIQLSDHRGRFDCELRSDAVTQFQTLFNNSYEGLPIVMLQFARVKMEKGYVFVESVDDVTRVLVDPHIAELI